MLLGRRFRLSLARDEVEQLLRRLGSRTQEELLVGIGAPGPSEARTGRN